MLCFLILLACNARRILESVLEGMLESIVLRLVVGCYKFVGLYAAPTWISDMYIIFV
jgi:hypothetical protein